MLYIKSLTMYKVHMHYGTYGCAYVWEIIHSLKLMDYLPIHTHKPYNNLHLQNLLFLAMITSVFKNKRNNNQEDFFFNVKAKIFFLKSQQKWFFKTDITESLQTASAFILNHYMKSNCLQLSSSDNLDPDQAWQNLIWIQNVWHSDSIKFLKKIYKITQHAKS